MTLGNKQLCLTAGRCARWRGLAHITAVLWTACRATSLLLSPGMSQSHFVLSNPYFARMVPRAKHAGPVHLPPEVSLVLCSATGLFKSMALGALARRATHLPGLLSELRPHLKRLLVGQSEALQAAAMALLEALLPKEPDSEAGMQVASAIAMHCMPCRVLLQPFQKAFLSRDHGSR